MNPVSLVSIEVGMCLQLSGQQRSTRRGLGCPDALEGSSALARFGRTITHAAPRLKRRLPSAKRYSLIWSLPPRAACILSSRFKTELLPRASSEATL